MSSNFSLVKEMHRKFKIANDSFPQSLTIDEYFFRIHAIIEELLEYTASVFEMRDGSEINVDETANRVMETLKNRCRLKEDHSTPEALSFQFDALIDLCVFAIGTAERQGFDFNEGFKRVMAANMQKELAVTEKNSKRGFKRDLVKPDGWKAPNLLDLVDFPKGVIVIEGPDGAGKSTLAHLLADLLPGEVRHQTWSEDIDKNMESYMDASLDWAEEISRNKVAILDRHWPSELIYADVYRGGTPNKDLSLKMYNRLNNLDAIYIWCLPTNESSEKSLLDEFEQLKLSRDEMYDNGMDEIVKSYYGLVYGEDTNLCPSKVRYLDSSRSTLLLPGSPIPQGTGVALVKDSLIYDRFSTYPVPPVDLLLTNLKYFFDIRRRAKI